MPRYINEDDFDFVDDENEDKGLIEDEELYEELDLDDALVEEEEQEEYDEGFLSEEEEQENDEYMFLNDYGTDTIEDDLDFDSMVDYEREDYWEEDKDGYEGLDINDLE